jgi:murein DD-endopeptidase MepM/ murein hydrolase activator NlpD
MGLTYRRGSLYLGGKRNNSRKYRYIALVLAVAAGVVCAFLGDDGQNDALVPVSVQKQPAHPPEQNIPVAQPENRIELTVNKGDTFIGILKENGVSVQQALDIQQAVREVFNLSDLTTGNQLVLVFSQDNQTLLGLEYETAAPGRLSVAVDGEKIEARVQQVEGFVKPRHADAFREMHIKVKKGDSLFNLLRGCGIEAGQIHALSRSVGCEYDLADITPGHPLKIWVARKSPTKLARLTYDIDPVKFLEVVPRGESFKAKTHTRSMEVSHERAQGTVRRSLYESAVEAGLHPEIVMDLTDIFGWDINFFTDIHEGDTYTVLYERYFVEGEPRGYGRVVAARFVIQGEERLAVYYDDGRGHQGYYDEHGKPIRKLFLKAPLHYRRISSGFSRSRIHPVFHVKRPHLGVDYAAPAGTPVVALGEGRITRCGWVKGFGKTITIKHPGGYATNYGHLSRFAKGVATGRRVGQGDVIGYVGKTGIATGPHLDFRVQRKGKYVNPLHLAPVNGPRLYGSSLAGFRLVSMKRLTMLDDISLDRSLKVSTLN